MFKYRIGTALIAFAIFAVISVYLTELIRQTERDLQIIDEFDLLGEQSGVHISIAVDREERRTITRLLGVYPIQLVMLGGDREDALLNCEQLVLLSNLSSLQVLWIGVPIEACSPKRGGKYVRLEFVEIEEGLTFEETYLSLKSLSTIVRSEFDVAVPAPVSDSGLPCDCTDEFGLPCDSMFTTEQIIEIEKLPMVKRVRASEFNFFGGRYPKKPTTATNNLSVHSSPEEEPSPDKSEE